jgi:FKBP-type peptidyl-prolyl cis-trans isomerase
MFLKMMKTVAVVIASILAISSCQSDEKSIEKKLEKDPSFGKTISYSMGYEYVKSTKQDSIPFDVEYFLQGVKDANQNSEPLYDEKEIGVVKQQFRKIMDERQNVRTLQIKRIYDSLGIAFIELSKKFLEENSKKPGVIVTKSGLQYEVLKKGTGPKAKISDLVKINLRGWLPNGSVFEDTYEIGQLMEYPVGQMFPGFIEAFQLMNKGSRFMVHMPARLAFDKIGSKPTIPPNSALKWEIEMVEIVDLSMPNGGLPGFGGPPPIGQ